MNCLLCKKHMYRYYDDELSPQLKLKIDRHLEACTSCRFQYDLTQMENQVLGDTSEIPEIAPDFNSRVMNAIKPGIQSNLADNVLVMTRDNRIQFKWSSVYAMSAIAVLLLALCFYIPGIFPTDQQQQQIAKSNQAPLVNQKSTAANMLGATGNADTGNTDIQLKLPSGNAKLGSSTVWDSIDVNLLHNTPQAKMDATIPNYNIGSRTIPGEAGRAERKESAKTLPVSSLKLKNIPEKYKLLSQDNSVANQTNYSYQTDDGSESINITLISSPAQEQASVSEANLSKEMPSDRLMMTAAPAAVENVSREVRVGDQTISVQLSGNISSDDLANLADKIVISSAPNI